MVVRQDPQEVHPWGRPSPRGERGVAKAFHSELPAMERDSEGPRPETGKVAGGKEPTARRGGPAHARGPRIPR